jgi:hypothetical protein
MNKIVKIIEKKIPRLEIIRPKYIKPGRWNIDYSKIRRNIDNANKDNCYISIIKKNKNKYYNKNIR